MRPVVLANLHEMARIKQLPWREMDAVWKNEVFLEQLNIYGFGEAIGTQAIAVEPEDIACGWYVASGFKKRDHRQEMVGIVGTIAQNVLRLKGSGHATRYKVHSRWVQQQ